MKWITILSLPFFLTACAWLHPGLVQEREVVTTNPPNQFLEPFTCGDLSIDVTTTTKTCK